MNVVHWIVIALIGAGVGYFGGMFGKGGSAIATPLLAAIGVAPIAAVASPLPATVPGTVVAAREYRRRGLLDRRVIVWTLAVGIPATVVGAMLAGRVGGVGLVLLTDVVVLAIGASMLIGASNAAGDAVAAPTSIVRIVVGAAVIGLAAGALANAGGFLLVPFFVNVLSLPIKRALGSSLAVASVLAVPGTLVHALLGHIDWRVTVVFGLASVPLSRLGARTAVRMDGRRLERVYGLGLTVLGAILLLTH